jgi:transcriptional regulator with XRE-family HTH domain
MVTASPVVARWELSRRLTRRRKELGIEVKTITDELGFTRNYWSAVENDRTLIAEKKLRTVVDLLQFSDEESEELLALREAGRARGWWEDYPEFDDEIRQYLGLEDGASHVRTHGGLLIPGHLQTDDYASSIIASDPAVSATNATRALEIRQRRRRRLLDPDRAVHYSATISEAALHQVIGSRQTQVAQLDHLQHLIEENPLRLEIRVLPFASDPGSVATSAGLVFLDYVQPSLPTIAVQESIHLTELLEAEDRGFDRLHLAWNDGFRRSLNRAESLSLVQRTASLIRT